MIRFIYQSIIQLRNFLYDIKIFNIYKSRIPVISVGNLTVGGTGKTPFVLFLINYFLKNNLTPLVISRGYGRASKGQVEVFSGSDYSVQDIGDEPYLINKNFPEVDIIINHKRAEAIQWAEKLQKKYDVILLDDGYQHRSVFRNLNILLINSRQNHDYLLPKGDLREPMSSIGRADCIVFTKGSSVSKIKNIPSKINQPQYTTKETFSKSNSECDTGIAFCGIGDSTSFKKTLDRLSIGVVENLCFKDHEHYSPAIIKKIEKVLKKTNQTAFFTTEKDWVKLPQDFIEKYDGCYIKMEISIKDESFYTLINKSI